MEGEVVVQAPLERAFAAVDQLQEVPPMRAWLFRIAHNRALDLLRSRAIRAAEPIEAAQEVADPESPDPVEVMMRRGADGSRVAEAGGCPSSPRPGRRRTRAA